MKKIILSFVLVCKNREDERYIDHQAIVKDREVVKDTDILDMQKLIEQKDLKIVSVSKNSLFKY